MENMLCDEITSQDIELLANENKILRKVLDDSFYSIYIVDGTGKTIYVNRVAERFLETDKSKLIGRNVVDLEAEGVFHPSVLRLVMKEKKQVTILQRTKAGLCLATGVPVYDEDGEIEFIFTNGRYLSGGKEKLDTEIISFIHKNDGEESNETPLVYGSRETAELLEVLKRLAPLDTTVLLLGESGVGKSAYAKYIHKNSNRAYKKMIEICCGAIPETLLESELFGYEGGAFTGANKSGKKGLVEQANGGILFLDEIGELSLNLQVKILRLLQERKIRRIGGNEDISIDTLIIAATNRDLEQMVKAGEFREDLYYRLNVVPITIRPLREKKEDISVLVDYFMEMYNKKYGRNMTITGEALEALENYSWPGNVRELENYIERMVIMSTTETLEKKDVCLLDPKLEQRAGVIVNGILPLKKAVEEMERQLFEKAYQEEGSSYKVAKRLGISQSLAYNKISKYIKKEE